MKSSLKTSTNNCDLVDVTCGCTSENATEVIKKMPYWKQMYISESLNVPSYKPDIEQLNSLDVSVAIIRNEIIKTPRSYDDTVKPPIKKPTPEGKLLSGRKLIIEGQLCQKIVYTANECTQPVHSVEFFVPFSSYIIVPKEIIFTNSDGTISIIDSCNVNFDVNACIEDATACAIDLRTILKQVTLLIYAVPTQSC